MYRLLETSFFVVMGNFDSTMGFKIKDDKKTVTLGKEKIFDLSFDPRGFAW